MGDTHTDKWFPEAQTTAWKADGIVTYRDMN